MKADWNDLARDTVVSYAALGRLIASPTSVIPFLDKQLQNREPVDFKLIERLVGNLDDDEFRVRERATKELEALGDRVAPFLRKALASGPSLEARNRLERLLSRIESSDLSAETVREVRVIEVLEAIGTLEARRLLEKLADGRSGMRLTAEARASADRLARQASVRP